MTVGLLTAAAAFGLSYLLYPVNGVKVEGARMYPESEAVKAVPERASLLTLNARSLENEVESNPWVEGARVTRIWESGIVAVQVQEHRPVLVAEVDGRRVVVAEDGAELPGLGGADLRRVELDGDQLEGILEVGKALREGGVALESVDAVGPGGVEATVEGRRVLFSDGGVGAGQVRALEGVMRRHPEARIFDLRSPERVVIGGESNVGAAGGADGGPRG